MKWVDRLSLKPGRIKLTDDNGNVKYYTWERADEPTIEGTPLKADNMNNLIQIGAVLGDVPDIPVDAKTLNGKSENMLDVLNAKHWDGNTPDMFVGYKDPGEQLDVANLDADTLGGHLPSYYLTHDYIKSDTFTNTTQSNGALYTGLAKDACFPIGFQMVGTFPSDVGVRFLTSLNGMWYLMCADARNTPVANTQLTIKVYYIEV